jgi:CRP/FNR family transcriptional regulator, cyclic AMP receptor protein
MSLTGPDSILVAPMARERLGALADARLILISASTQKRLFESPTAARVIVEAVEGGVRNCRESLAQFGSRRHIDRVRLKLLQLARAHGKVGSDGLLLDIPRTHELLADMVGSTRETVTRSLAHLSQEGLIRHERGRYLLAAPPEAIAG